MSKPILCYLSCALFALVTAAGSHDFDSMCMSCVLNNHKYCESNDLCVETAGNCPGDFRDMSSGCTTNTYCAIGNEGVIHIGDLQAEGGKETAGSISVDAPSDDPCAIILLNKQSEDLTFTVSGDDTGFFTELLSFPFSQTTVSTDTFKMAASVDELHVFVGSKSASGS